MYESRFRRSIFSLAFAALAVCVGRIIQVAESIADFAVACARSLAASWRSEAPIPGTITALAGAPISAYQVVTFRERVLTRSSGRKRAPLAMAFPAAA